MLKEIIREYVEGIDALRDFVESIKLRLEEHANKLITASESSLLKERMEKLQAILGEMQEHERVAFFKRPQSEIESDQEFRKRFGFEFTIQLKKDEGSVELQFPMEADELSAPAKEILYKTEDQKKLLYKSSLITLTSTVELFLSQLLHFYFDQFPDAVGADAKAFSLDDLKSLGTIEEAKNHLIESRVEMILRDSLEEWFRFLREKVKLSMGYIDGDKDQLIEVYQRRNILIHNGGRVNSIYLSKVSPKLRENVTKDQLLTVTPEYLNRALDLFELNFVLAAAELWKKLDPKDEQRPDTLTQIAYSHLLKERWKIAEGLSYFQMCDKQTSEKSQIYGQLNYWQSVKWQGRFEEIRAAVEQADFSAKDPLYQLGLHALQDKTEEFFSLLPTVMKSEKLTVYDLRNWPIFREMRSAARYESLIETQHFDSDESKVNLSASIN